MQKPGSYLSEMGDLLLQFADNQEILDQATQVRGSEIIERPYLAFLGSMTPPSIKAYARAGAEIWNDGLFGRMTFSCPPRQLVLDEAWGREFVPVPTKLIEELKNWHERLIEPVVNISSEEIKGKGKRYTKTWTVEPQLKMLDMETDAYEAWKNYRSWLKKTVATFSPIHDFDATYGRLANTALGIAALAASIHGSEKIHLYHWALGQVQAEEWRKGVHRFHAQVNSYERAEDQMEKLIVEYLTQKGTEARIKDMRDDCRPIRRYTPKQVQDQVTYMEKQGVLSQSKKGKTVFYDLASKAKKSQTK